MSHSQSSQGFSDQNREPQFAGLLPAITSPLASGPGIAAFTVAGILAAILALAELSSDDTRVPMRFADLSDSAVTPIDSTDATSIKAAAANLRLAPAVRAQIEQDVLAGRRRIGWIVFTDSMDPDGDAIVVEAGGLVQNVLLSKAWMPVAVPLDDGPITITAVRDGGGGGITLALATRQGPMGLRALVPGEKIEVARP